MELLGSLPLIRCYRGRAGAPPSHRTMSVVMLLLLFLLALIWGGSARWGGAPWGGALHLLHPGGPQHLHILTRTYGDPLCLRLGGRGE